MGGGQSFIFLNLLSQVIDQENRELIRVVSVKEIRRVLCSMEDKAPNPNGFPLFSSGDSGLLSRPRWLKRRWNSLLMGNAS